MADKQSNEQSLRNQPAFKLARAWGQLTLDEVSACLCEHGIDPDVQTWTRQTTLRAAEILDANRARIIAEREE